MNKPKNIFGKNESLELKGIAIILMLFHHLFRVAQLFDGYTVSFFPLKEINVVNLAYASKICVSMFAFISGYGLYCSYKEKTETAQKWVYRRYIKTFSGYWFIWLVSFIVCQIIDGRSSKIFFSNGLYKGILYVILNFFGLDNLFVTPSMNAIWWYMSAAIVFIILMPFIYKQKDNLLLILTCAILLPRALLGHDGAVINVSGTAAFAFLIPYILGSIFARYSIFLKCTAIGKSRQAVKIYIFILEMWGIVFLYKMYHNLDRGLFWEIHYGLFPIICLLFLVEFVLPIKWLNKPLMFLGKHSMNMYLVHAILLTYAKGYLYSCKHFALITLVFIGVSVGISLIIEYMKRVTKFKYFISLIT